MFFIRKSDQERVIENRFSFFKADPMLFEICFRFPGIPFKYESHEG